MLFLSVSGCLRENPASLPETRIFTNGSLDLENARQTSKSLYIEAVDQRGHPLRFPEKAVLKDAGSNFVVVNSPSAAAFILHIDILQEGEVNEAALEKLVNSGFGSHAAFSGSGNEAILADALLVQRRVPNEKRESISNLQNISARNTLESARMRIGIMITGKKGSAAKIHDELAEALLLEMRKALWKSR